MAVRMQRATRRRRILAVVAASAAMAAACSFGVDSYRQFRGAVDSGATCGQLVDIAERFAGRPEEDRVARDLEQLGCKRGADREQLKRGGRR